jgi:hypothetical protein
VLGQVCVVVCALGIGEGHENHVAAFFEGHVFGFAVGVAWWLVVSRSCCSIRETWELSRRTSSVREGGSDVVDRILVRPVACLLVDEERIEEVFEESGVGVNGDGVEGENHFANRVSGRSQTKDFCESHHLQCLRFHRC